ncbi:MAG TPA: FAD:protein FMN transferase [Blastocatellia bacterium]|nr:FAD:protein FMN transferase [Blastocatellia bacterium]
MARTKRLLVSVTVMAALLACVAAENSLKAKPADLARYEFAEAHMGTQFRIVLYAQDDETARHASAHAFDRIARLDATMSDYRETSELMTACKRAAREWVTVSGDLFRVLAASQRFARRSAGAFDITVGPVVQLWRRARRRGELPDAEKLAAARRLVGYARLRLDARRRAMRLNRAGMRLDLGGIAKGYAADAALAVLKQHGVTSALVAAGGDIVVGDAPPGSRGWTVAVRSITATDEASMIHLRLANAAVSTSGDAEQFVEINGTRYSHIIDPRTGQPLTGRRSVTVVARDGTTSDALATAASVLTPSRALRLIDRTASAAAHIEQMSSDRVTTSDSKRWASIPRAVGFTQ